MRLYWTNQAFADRDEIIDHIAKDNVVAALANDDKIVVAVERLLLFPQMGRTGRVANTRELVIAQSNYVVVYDIDSRDDQITILRVLHGAQDWPGELGKP